MKKLFSNGSTNMSIGDVQYLTNTRILKLLAVGGVPPIEAAFVGSPRHLDDCHYNLLTPGYKIS